MGKKAEQALGDITTAARALESDLAAFEAAAATALRLPLTSRRNLDKAAHAVDEAAESQRRIAEHIHALMAALTTARETNQRTSEALTARGLEIQAKVDEHGRHLAAFQTLGKVAREISDAVRTLGAVRDADRGATAARLGEIEAHMTTVVDQAQVLMKSAQQASLGELARDVEGLHKQVQSARNKLGLVRARLAQA